MLELLPVFLSLFLVEVLLSADNALINAALADQFPKKDRNRLLRIGILLGVAFRIIALLLMAVIIKNVWLKFVCGLYLMFIGIKHISRVVDRTGHLIKQTDSMKVALLQIAMADRVFSISNVFAVATFATTFSVVIFAIVVSMLGVTFAAPLFARALKRYKGMSQATFTIVFLLGISMCVEVALKVHIANSIKVLTIFGVIGFTMLYEHSFTLRRHAGPVLRGMQYILGLPLDAIYLFKRP